MYCRKRHGQSLGNRSLELSEPEWRQLRVRAAGGLWLGQVGDGYVTRLGAWRPAKPKACDVIACTDYPKQTIICRLQDNT